MSRVCVCVCVCVCVYRREELGQLSVLEVDHTPSSHTHHRPVSSPDLAVKEYVRAGAGHHVPSPYELRPPKILVETMDYLMNRFTGVGGSQLPSLVFWLWYLSV